MSACVAIACAVIAASPAVALADNGGTSAPGGTQPSDTGGASAPGDASTSKDGANATGSPSKTSARPPKPGQLGSRTLREGMSGRDVRGLQVLLTSRGFKVTVDGQFGPRTKAAVERAQRAYHLKATGIVDAATLAALRGPMPSAAAQKLIDEMVAAGNKIAKYPYRYGGGHESFTDSAYDCSGSVSYVLHAAGLLSSPETSGELMSYGLSGPGKWVTIYTNPTHVFMVIDGRRFDTGALYAGSRWSSTMISTNGYWVRHPAGL